MSQSVYIEERPNHRMTLMRRALLLMPGSLLTTGLLIFAIANRPSSIAALFAVVILGLTSVALSIEAIAAARDLRSQPTTTRGSITRLWKKTRYLFFGRVDYMLVGRSLFEVNTVTAMELRAGHEVVVAHWPHSHVVISIARASADAAPRSFDYGDRGRP